MSDDLNPQGELCVRCGQPAVGYARIGDDRYCHPDDEDREDCYELGQWDQATTTPWLDDVLGI